MSIVHKKKYEERLNGLTKVIGRDLDIYWGPTPQTDGEKIYLPDKPVGIWDSEEIIRAGFSHEIAHNMFESDIHSMWGWIETWSNDGNKYHWHDPYGLVEDVAESVIQIVEDQRIESLYGEIYHGAKDRFANVLHKRIAEINEADRDPATALLLLRTARWNITDRDFDAYQRVQEEWGDSDIDINLLWDSLGEVEEASMDATFLIAERIMQHILPWYEDRVRFAEEEDLQNLQQELQEEQHQLEELEEEQEQLENDLMELEQEKREETADGNFDEVDEIEDKIEKKEREIKDKEREREQKEREVDRKQDQVERKSERQKQEEEQITEIQQTNEERSIEDTIENEDYEPPEQAFNGDLDDLEEELEKSAEEANNQLNKIREEMSPDEIPEQTPEEAVEGEVVKKESVGAKKGEVYHGIVDDMVREFRQIRGRKRNQLGTMGTNVDIDALIQDEAQGGLETEIMHQEVSELGFCCSVVLDLSMSMIGPKLNVCRNVGATLYETFEKLSDQGMHVDFPFIGYGGHHLSNKVMIKECESTEDVRKITHDPNFANTPTWHAVRYMREKMRQLEGDKFMVIVTDGTPTGFGRNDKEISKGRALSYTKQEVNRCESRGISVFTLGIGVDLSDEEMRRIYGRYENVDDESEAGQILLDFVKGNLRRHVELL